MEIQNFSMKLSFLTSKNSFYKEVFTAFAFLVLVLSSILPVFAVDTASNALQKTDIPQVGIDMYTDARKWEVETMNWYNQEAFVDFSKKVNALIASDSELRSAFSQLCADCEPIIQESLDTDKNLLEYLKNEPKSGAPDLGVIIAAHLHPTIKEKTGGQLSLISILGKKVEAKIVNSIRAQVQEQTSSFRDVSGMGLYYDGNTDNSPYDLLDDIRRIDEIFFREAPEFGEYSNTSSEDASALITGKVSTGTWGGGENYNIDILSEIEGAIGGGEGGSGSSTSWDNELAGDCDSGFCVTLDFIQNTHYFLWSGSGWKGKNSFQGIFEEWLDWIIKNGDNRNFACKVSPTINTWESEFDLNIKLSEVFSWAGVFVFWKTPPFLKGFFDRNKSTASSDSASSAKAKSKEEQQVLDSLKRSFKRYDLDFEKPTNIKASQWQLLYSYAVNRADNSVRVTDTLNSINLARDDHDAVKAASGASLKQRPYVQEKNVDSIKHMEKAFDETASRTRMLYELVKAMKVIMDYLWEKWECQWS